MAIGLDYALADFLLFSPSTYWRLFEQLNAAVWPLHVVITGALTAIALAVVAGWRQAGLAAGLVLALCWASVAHLFFASYYAPINWAITWITPFAWAQASLLILLAPGLQFEAPTRTPWPQYCLIGLALAYPLVGAVSGRPIVQAEVAGLAPDPTALLTLGLVSMAAGWRSLVLSVLPIGWIMLSAVTLVAMEVTTAWALIGAIGLTGLALFRRF